MNMAASVSNSWKILDSGVSAFPKFLGKRVAHPLPSPEEVYNWSYLLCSVNL